MKTKICTKCGNEFLATAEFFGLDKRNISGLGARCRKCCTKAVLKCRQSERGKYAHRNAVKRHQGTIKGYLRCVFSNFNQRCNNPKHISYKNYGGRGVQNKFKFCNEFRNYVIDVLGYDTIEKIKGLQIDRINNNGHYEKGNIRFVTRSENNRNKRDYK